VKLGGIDLATNCFTTIFQDSGLIRSTNKAPQRVDAGLAPGLCSPAVVGGLRTRFFNTVQAVRYCERLSRITRCLPSFVVSRLLGLFRSDGVADA